MGLIQWEQRFSNTQLMAVFIAKLTGQKRISASFNQRSKKANIPIAKIAVYGDIVCLSKHLIFDPLKETSWLISRERLGR